MSRKLALRARFCSCARTFSATYSKLVLLPSADKKNFLMISVSFIYVEAFLSYSGNRTCLFRKTTLPRYAAVYCALRAYALRFALLTRSKTLSIYFPMHRYITLVDSFCTECVYSGKLSQTERRTDGQTLLF